MAKEVNVSLTKSQIEFLKLDCAFPLFRAGYAAGKSHLMGFSAVQDAYHSASALIGVYEPSYDLIRLTAIPRVQYWLNEFGVRFTLNKQDHAIYTSNNNIGDFLFKSMENPDMLVSYETYRSHVDELDTLTAENAEKVWFKLLGRNRQVPAGVPEEHKRWNEDMQKFEVVNKMSAYTTPEGFKFCHRMWEGSKNPDYQSVKGKTMDNPTLTDAFIKQMKSSYPAALIEAYMNGEWVNMASGTVYNLYHRYKCESNETIRDKETLYIGCDFNVTKQAATIYVKRNGGEFHAVDELVDMYDTPEMIRIINNKWADQGHQIIMYPDASGRARKSSNAAESDIYLLKQAGFEVRAHNKNPDVRDRVLAANQAFSQGKAFVNHYRCPTVAKCLEQQAYNANGDPDKKSGNDHQNDATTYPLAYEFGVRKPLYAIPFSFVQKY